LPYLFRNFKQIHATLVQKSNISTVNPSFSKYLSYAEIADYLYSLRHLPAVTVKEIGESNEKRKILAFILSKGAGRPVVFIEAGIHGREWISPMTALFCIKNLLSDNELTSEVDWIIVPLLNPDGYEYSRNHQRAWRKNVTKNEGPWCDGVDLNRNFEYKWGGVGSGPDPCMENYRGIQAWSEKEARALRDLIIRNKSNIKLYISLHSFLQAIAYPWSHTKDKPSNWKDLEALGLLATDRVFKKFGTIYEVGQASLIDRVHSGTTTDWVKASVGIKYVYLIELPSPKYTFQVPENQIAQIATEFYEALTTFGTAVKFGLKES